MQIVRGDLYLWGKGVAMPTEQNNESNDLQKERVWRLKLFLVFGPYIVALIPIILCAILICSFSSVKKSVAYNSESIEGIIMQQRDLSIKVDDLAAQQEALNKRISDISDKTLHIEQDILTYHPNAKNRGENAWPKKVYLTFDDGPSPNTAAILDVLKRYNVKATFFAVGKESESLIPMYKRILDEGHTLGMHSYSHVYDDIYSSRSAFEEDLDKISSYIYEQTGYTPTIYRFPGGSKNTLIGNKFDDFCTVLDERGIKYYDWNISTQDASNPALPAEEIVENALGDIEKYEEVMILMHDLGNKTTTVAALPTIIEALQAEGIPIMPIDESTMLIQHHTNTE